MVSFKCALYGKLLTISQTPLLSSNFSYSALDLCKNCSAHSQIKRVDSQSVSQAIRQSVNQSIYQSTNQPTEQSMDQSASHTIIKNVSYSTSQLDCLSVLITEYLAQCLSKSITETDQWLVNKSHLLSLNFVIVKALQNKINLYWSSP